MGCKRRLLSVAGCLLACLWLPQGKLGGAELIFRRGDTNGDGRVDLSDGIATLNYLFLGSFSPGCLDAADCDDSGTVVLTDAVFTFGFLFLGGPPPPPPGHLGCGPDPTPDGLSCERSERCPQETPLDLTVPTTLAGSTGFLYSGPDPVQTGVAPGTIEEHRAAVLRGRVTDRSGSPLAGVAVTVLHHPEFGRTRTRPDGVFDMVVNGGGPLTVDYVLSGYLPVQRQVQARWQEFNWLPDVVLIPYDPQVTRIDLNAAVAIQVAQGSVASDADGTRQATLFFTQGTQAHMVLPGGAAVGLASLHVRATEYTVGETGAQAMPAALPPWSGYTYAVELSADEAVAAGAVQVRFDRPVTFYVENFLGFPAGGIVPVGYYDRQAGRWVGSENGRVIRVLAVEGGLAELDTDGDALADDAAALEALGITESERERLGGLYQAGQTLWRVEVSHFTPWDCNWPYGPPPDADGPNGPPPDNGPKDPNPCEQDHSIVDCHNQILGERLPLVGTELTLNYRSDRVWGRLADRSLAISLSGNSVPASLVRIDLEVLVAGQRFNRSFPPAPEQTYTFTWDGLDAYGRRLQGAQPATVRIGYAYGAVYLQPAAFSSSFSRFSGGGAGGGRAVISDRARFQIGIWQEFKTSMGGYTIEAQGLGGWSLDVHHVHDPLNKTVFLGNGRNLGVQDPVVNSLVAGSAVVNGPRGITADAEGNVYVATSVSEYGIVKIRPNGTTVRVAIPPARSNETYHDVEVDALGNLYVIAAGSQMPARLVKIAPDGTRALLLESNALRYGGIAVDRQNNIFAAGDSSVSVGTPYRNQVVRIAPDGPLAIVAGSGETVSGTTADIGDGRAATGARFFHCNDVAVDDQGNMYIAEYSRVRKVGLDGIITTVAGPAAGAGLSGFSGDGGPATQARFQEIRSIAVDRQGYLYILDGVNQRIRQVSPNGIVTTLVGTGTRGFNGDGGPAGATQLHNPQGIALDPEGNLLIADTSSHRVRKVEFAYRRFIAAGVLIPAPSGDEAYLFSDTGLHLETLHTLTGAALQSFTYDPASRLTEVTDGDGNVTVIERDAAGNATAIVSPYGQRTLLSLDQNGYLAEITNPAGESRSFSYTPGGLMLTQTNPRGGVHHFSYDELGRLVHDEDPAGGFITLERARTEAGYEVRLTTAEGRTTVYAVEDLPDGSRRRANTFPGDLQTVEVRRRDGSRTVTYPGGTSVDIIAGPDPRWGMQAPLIASLTTTVPGGPTSTLIATRSVQLADAADVLSIETLTDVVSVNGQPYTNVFERASRQFTLTTPEGRRSLQKIDGLGRLVERQEGDLQAISLLYDDRGRPAMYTEGSGASARKFIFGYDDFGEVASLTDPLGRIARFEYDLTGRRTRRILPEGREIEYAYDRTGNLTSLTPPGRQAHSFTYTPFDELEAYNPPEVGIGSSSIRHTYNLDRDAIRIDFPDGATIGFGQDAAGRLSTVSVPQGDYGFEYATTTGLVASFTDPSGGMLSFRYQGDHLVETSWTGAISGSISYTLSSDFDIAAQRINDGPPLAFLYDGDGLLTQAGALMITRETHTGHITATSLGGVTTASGFDSFGELETLRAAFGTSVLYEVRCTRDARARITTKTETVEGTTTVYDYGYDAAGRLATVARDGVRVALYTYDPNGNRLSFTGPAGTLTAAHDEQDRLLSYGDATYSHTPRGELLEKTVSGQTTRYEYDVLGNLVAVDLPGDTRIEYVIDGLNRRTGKRVKGLLLQAFLYEDDLRPVAELDGGGMLVTRFVYGTSPNVPDNFEKGGRIYRIISDHLGSVRLVVDVVTGAIVQRLDYDEFGKVLEDSNPGFQPFGFGGGIYDTHTKLCRFGARDYDAETGRWTARDLLLFAGGDANLYAYVLNDPLTLTDRDGAAPEGSRLLDRICKFFFDTGAPKKPKPKPHPALDKTLKKAQKAVGGGGRIRNVRLPRTSVNRTFTGRGGGAFLLLPGMDQLLNDAMCKPNRYDPRFQRCVPSDGLY
jgi:RHS repeat-associated protein